MAHTYGATLGVDDLMISRKQSQAFLPACSTLLHALLQLFRAGLLFSTLVGLEVIVDPAKEPSSTVLGHRIAVLCGGNGCIGVEDHSRGDVYCTARGESHNHVDVP